MPGSADANLLIAFGKPSDALHARALTHMAEVGRLRASATAVVESFTVLHRSGVSLPEFLGSIESAFDVEELLALRDAAEILERGIIRTPFDAYHLAAALRRGEPLHTADKALLASDYPTVPF